MQPHDSLKGRSWVLESDLRSGAAVRLDKTGKTLLTLLRHLGRLVAAPAMWRFVVLCKEINTWLRAGKLR